MIGCCYEPRPVCLFRTLARLFLFRTLANLFYFEPWPVCFMGNTLKNVYLRLSNFFLLQIFEVLHSLFRWIMV